MAADRYIAPYFNVGIATPKPVMDLIDSRLKIAEQMNLSLKRIETFRVTCRLSLDFFFDYLELRQSFNRLCALQVNFHSLRFAFNPRLIHRPPSCTVLICPNTGSTVLPL